MSQIIRAQYRAVLRKEAAPERIQQAFAAWEERLQTEQTNDQILTGTMCRYGEQIFFYLEYIIGEENTVDGAEWRSKLPSLAQELLGHENVLEKWPSFDASKIQKYRRKKDIGYTCIRYSGSMNQDHWIPGSGKNCRIRDVAGLLCFILKSYFPMSAIIRRS